MISFKNSLFRVLSFIYPVTIQTFESAISGKLELTYEYGRLVVNTSVANYSYGSLHEVFRSALKRLEFKDKPSKVLILGFGAGSIANILVKDYQLALDIDGVELDPVMLQIYKKYFPLDIDSLALYNEDVLSFLENNSTPYDYILIDVFDNLKVPENLLNQHFIDLLQKASKSHTQIAMNTMLNDKHDFVTLWKQSFGGASHTASYDVSNLVLFKIP